MNHLFDTEAGLIVVTSSSIVLFAFSIIFNVMMFL